MIKKLYEKTIFSDSSNKGIFLPTSSIDGNAATIPTKKTVAESAPVGFYEEKSTSASVTKRKTGVLQYWNAFFWFKNV